MCCDWGRSKNGPSAGIHSDDMRLRRSSLIFAERMPCELVDQCRPSSSSVLLFLGVDGPKLTKSPAFRPQHPGAEWISPRKTGPGPGLGVIGPCLDLVSYCEAVRMSVLKLKTTCVGDKSGCANMVVGVVDEAPGYRGFLVGTSPGCWTRFRKSEPGDATFARHAKGVIMLVSQVEHRAHVSMGMDRS